jgi:predicted RNA-binding protein associated with RNAse of E/G family
MEIKIIDGFVWFVVTDKAKEIFNSDLFELFVITDDGGEYQILDHDALNEAIEKGLDIAIEGDYINM